MLASRTSLARFHRAATSATLCIGKKTHIEQHMLAPRRTYFVVPTLARQTAEQRTKRLPIASSYRGYCEVPINAAEADSTSAQSTVITAMPIAMSVNKLKRQHQQAADATERRQLELEAWNQLNSLTEDAIMTSEGKAVALLLNSWAYFSKHWQKGRDGPDLTGSSDSARGTKKMDQEAEEEE